MKNYFAILSLISFSLNGQDVGKIKSELSAISTLEQANAYLSSHANVVGQVFELDSRTDTSIVDKQILSAPQADVLDFKSQDEKQLVFFKPLEATEYKSYRVQDIFLDNARISLEKIETLRKEILKRLAKGESFESLAAEFSMDGGSKRGGDLGWFDGGMMVKEFESAVRKSKVGDVYTVDVPSMKWYYVVKTTHPPRVDKKLSVLYVEVNRDL